MRRVNFDLDVLRSFTTGVELGSFSKAAERLNKSTSAVSAQLKRLEEQAGVRLLRRSGRTLTLTEPGETMLAYARRLLDLNDEAATAVRGGLSEEWIRLGLQEDFADILPAVLARFVRAHPEVRLEARLGRNTELLGRIASGHLDVAFAWDDGSNSPRSERIADVPMRWIGPAGGAAIAPRYPTPDPVGFLRGAMHIAICRRGGPGQGGSRLASQFHESHLGRTMGRSRRRARFGRPHRPRHASHRATA